MSFKFIALPTFLVEGLQAGQADANGMVAEHSVSDGTGNPCRHCLSEIPKAQPMLILACRPFTTVQPYAEVGPVFLCANRCKRYSQTTEIPKLYRNKTMLIRGYDRDQRIIYGTGKTIAMQVFDETANQLFSNRNIAFIHVRSPTNNCYHFRVERF